MTRLIRPTMILALAVVLQGSAAGCGEAMPIPQDVEALSNHYVQVTFTEPAGPAAELPSNYVITAPDDRTLTVHAALLSPDALQVILTTGAQDQVEYELSIHSGPASQTRLTFSGSDEPEPGLLSAMALDNAAVLLTFTEPMDDVTTEDVSCYDIEGADGDAHIDIAILNAALQTGDQTLLLTTSPQNPSEHAVHVTNVKGRESGKFIDPTRCTASYFASPIDDTQLRVVGAASTNNSTVVVVFNRSVSDSALDLANHMIVQENVHPEAAALVVTGAAFTGPDRTAVELTTLAQSEVQYRVIVVNVQDLQGNQLAPKNLFVDPTSAVFWGSAIGCSGLMSCTNGHEGLDGNGQCQTDDDCTGASACAGGADCAGACQLEECILPDSDGDRLPDDEEQRGWVVFVVLASGEVSMRDVTSDPNVADTDGDGLNDLEEKRRTSDPRDADSDDDLLQDNDEVTKFFSSLTNQDTDGDGLDDSREVNLHKTAPILADSDGDGLSDSREVLELSRDPRIADMPIPRIEIGDIALRLDTRFSFTDTLGQSRTSEESVSTTLQQSEEKSFSFSDTSTTKHSVEVKLGVEKTLTAPPKFTGSLGYSFATEHQTTVSQSSTRASQEAYQESLATAETVDETHAVTREVIGASMQVALSIANLGDIPYAITNLEVTALQQDPIDRQRFIPVATLIPATQLNTGLIPAYTSGPFIPERGPFIFESRDIFPILVEDLLKNPRGLIFKVANFDIEDEFGRNFAFASQEINDKTVGITIDFGNSRVERFRLATYNVFDPAGAFDEGGHARGILMRDALQDLLGLIKNAPVDAVSVGHNGCGETWAVGDDVQLENPICHEPLRFEILSAEMTGVVLTAGPNLRIDSIPQGDDLFAIIGECQNDPNRACMVDDDCVADSCVNVHQEVIVDGGDGCAQTAPRRDDAPARIGTCQGTNDQCLVHGDCAPNVPCILQVQQTGCATGGPDGEIMLGGSNGVIDTVPGADDLRVTISGYGTEIIGVCDGDAPESLQGQTCDSDANCLGGSCRQTEFLTRVKGISNETAMRCDGDSPPQNIGGVCATDDDCGGNGHCVEVLDRFWQVMSSVFIEPDTDFDDIVLHAGDRISLAYVQDRDGDGLIAREEFLYGSSDQPPLGVNSDGCPFGQGDERCVGLSYDSIGDFEEVKRGWEVAPVGRLTYFAFSDPALPDLDLDRLKDDQEQLQATDPGKRDTDDDGVADFSEVYGYKLLDRDNKPVGQVPVYEGEVILDGGDGLADCAAQGDDEQVVILGNKVGGKCVGGDGNHIAEPTAGNALADTRVLQGSDDVQEVSFGEAVGDGEVIILPGLNGIIDSTPGDADGDGIFDGGDDAFGPSVQCGVNSDCSSSNCRALPGGVIVSQGPDGVLDTFLLAGDDFIAQFHVGMFATDPLNRDTDGDTLFDGVEADLGFLGANPNDPTDAADFRDEDRDGLVNREEMDGWVPVFRNVSGDDVCRDGYGDEVLVPFPQDTCSADGITFCAEDDDCIGICIDFTCSHNSSIACIWDGDCDLGECTDREDVRAAHAECIVTSDTFEPDSDFDGLPDLFEFTFFTHPKDSDTDDDGLLDYDELDPDSQFSVDITSFRDFEEQCFEADRCEFDTSLSLNIGTSLKAVDTDEDGRPDFQEIFEPWAVSVTGEDSYLVFSSPLNGDADLDELIDGAEQAQGTDPNRADTDDDTVPDGLELLLETDPLRQDQRVKFNYSSITVAGDCDPGTSGGDFEGKLKVQVSGGNPIELVNLNVIDGVDEGNTIVINKSKQFVIQEGDAIIAFSTQVKEVDIWSGDEQLGSFSRSYSYPIDGELEAIELRQSDTCRIVITLDIGWLNEPIPAIELDVTAAKDTVDSPGEDVEFGLLVTNVTPELEVTIDSLDDSSYGSLDGHGDCSIPQSLAPHGQAGDTYACSFTAFVGGNVGETVTHTITASGYAVETGDTVQDLDSATVSVGGMYVTNTPTPAEVNDPGGDVTFRVTVINTFSTDSITVDGLADDVFGDIADAANPLISGTSCAVPQTIPAGEGYVCSFTAFVGGSSGDTHTDVVTASGEKEDGTPVTASGFATVDII